MTLNRSTNEIKEYSGQVFTTEKFDVSKIRDRVRLLTGYPDILINKFLLETIQEFCKETWILRKLIQVADVVTEVDNDSEYYMVEIDLEDYLDDLICHDINEISINGVTYTATKNSYLGDPTGSNEIDTTQPGAYINPDTYIGTATYVGGTLINVGELTDGFHYEIVDDTTIKIWPVDLDDVIIIPVIFKTDTVSTITEIPYILENYYKQIASGVIAELAGVPGAVPLATTGVQGQPAYVIDEEYHRTNYRRGISKARYDYAKQYKGNKIQETFFAL